MRRMKPASGCEKRWNSPVDCSVAALPRCRVDLADGLQELGDSVAAALESHSLNLGEESAWRHANRRAQGSGVRGLSARLAGGRVPPSVRRTLALFVAKRLVVSAKRSRMARRRIDGAGGAVHGCELPRARGAGAHYLRGENDEAQTDAPARIPARQDTAAKIEAASAERRRWPPASASAPPWPEGDASSAEQWPASIRRT